MAADGTRQGRTAGAGGRAAPGAPGAALRSRRAVLGTLLAIGTALALPPTATAAPGDPAPPGQAGSTSLSPAALPPAGPTPPTIATVPFAPGARDASGAREAGADGPLRLVAVTWTGPAPDRIELRSRDAAGRWSTWSGIEPVPGERSDAPAARGGSDPVWVGDHTAVQVRATRAGAPVEDGLEVLRVDPGTSPADDAIGRQARTPAAPSYVTRAQWGADESMMSWPPRYSGSVRAVTIHHTSESNDYGPGDSAKIVRAIYAYHAKSQGWGDIGYNALVDKFGTVFEGRAGGLDRAVVAAHAGGFNQDTFGVAFMGEHSRAPIEPAQFEAVARLVAWKLGRTDPDQRVDLVSSGGGTSRFPKGRTASVPALFAHRDVGSTACPGDAAFAAMPKLRARVREMIAAASPDVRAGRPPYQAAPASAPPR